MQLEVGAIVQGRVTGVTKFGAFVALENGKSGLVHISEVANTFVSEIRDFITENQEVKVKIIGIGDDGKINLSIKKAEPPRQEQRRSSPRPAYTQRPMQQGDNNVHSHRQPVQQAVAPSADAIFEDKLKQFILDSDSKMAGNKLYAERRNNRKRK